MNGAVEYQFRDFRISTAKQVLFYKGQKQLINTKAYYLLLKLVQNSGEILTKDDLIEAVWPNQVVTDAALSKQILRLRKIINDQDSLNPIIETLRGTGYRFSVAVKKVNAKPHTSSSTKEPRFKHKWSAVVLLGVFAVLFYAITQTSVESNTSAPKSGISLMLLADKNTSSLATVGHLKYISTVLENQSSVLTLYPETSWSEGVDPKELAIDFVTQGQSQYAALIDFSQQKHIYLADITLRNKTTVINQQSIQSDNMLNLLKDTSGWLHKELIKDPQIKTKNPAYNIGFTEDRYALESYLLGINENKLGGNYAKAGEYFETAVLKDPNFSQAWFELAHTKIRLGDFKGALSIGNTQLNKLIDQSDDEILFGFYYLKALANFRLQNFDESKLNLEASLTHVGDKNNPMEQIRAFRSLVFLAQVSEDWNNAEQHTIAQIKLTEEYFPLSKELGHTYYMKAEINVYQKKLQEAQKALETTLYHWQKDNNPDNMIMAYGLMNQINLALSDYDQGILNANEADVFLQRSEFVVRQHIYLTPTTMILNLRGLFDRADTYIKHMSKLADETGNPIFQLTALMLKMHGYYVQGKFEQIKAHASAIENILENNPQLEDMGFFYSWITFMRSRYESIDIALEKIKTMKQRFPELFEIYASDMKRAQAHIQIRMGQVNSGLELLTKVEQAYRDINEHHVANYVGFEILEVMSEHPGHDYQTVINRVGDYTNYDYLFFKLQAQFKAKEGDYIAATMLMNENKLKANQLWTAKDQLLLESYEQQMKQVH